MNDLRTKTGIRRDMTYTRRAMQQIDQAMRNDDWAAVSEMARELSGIWGTVDNDALDHIEAAREAADDEPNPLAVQVPAGAWDQDVWNAWTR